MGIRKFINICLLTIELNFVWITPGQIQLTLIPLGPNSCASTLVNPNKAVLLTEYGPRTYTYKRNYYKSYTYIEYNNNVDYICMD